MQAKWHQSSNKFVSHLSEHQTNKLKPLTKIITIVVTDTLCNENSFIINNILLSDFVKYNYGYFLIKCQDIFMLDISNVCSFYT